MDENTRKVKNGQQKYAFKEHIWNHIMSFPFPWNYIVVILLIIGQTGGISYVVYKLIDLVHMIISYYIG
jgi:hypothetical protein